MSTSPEELQIEFQKLRQYLLDSLDNGMIKGDHYDCAQYIISRAFPLETREVHINEGTLEEDSEPSKTGGIPIIDLLFEAVNDKETFISDFRKAIKECGTSNPDEAAKEIINSRS